MDVSYSQQFWIRQSSPTTKWLKKCFFTDTLNGWAVGDSGTIIHTSNAGQSWVIQNSGIIYPISNVFFLNKRLGWCIANSYESNGTRILKTTNSGGNWSYSIFPDTNTIYYTIFFLDSLTGYLGGQYGTIYKTINSGVNWTRCQIDSGLYATRAIYKFSFINPQSGFAAGGLFDAGGVIWKTTDYGAHWSSQYVSPEPIFDLYVIDSLRAIGSGGDYEYGTHVVKTYNRGVSWNYNSLQAFGVGYSMSFRTRKELWIALGYGPRIEQSTDTGNTFRSIPVPDTSGIYDIQFIDTLHGWAFGTYGAIYKFNSSVAYINPNTNTSPGEYLLFQNFPNPFNPKTKINYKLPITSYVKVIVYDILGRLIETLTDMKQNPGMYDIEWDGTKYPSGTYFYELTAKSEAGDFVQSKRMVMIK